MSYVERNLITGERVLYQTGCHWIVLVGPCVFAAMFAVGGVVLMGSIAALGVTLLSVAAAMIWFAVLRRNSVEMAVTNRRVVIKTGILGRRTFELLLAKVESIGVEEGLLGRMFGYGTVIVRGTGGTPELFKAIEQPLQFRTQVQSQIEERHAEQPALVRA